MQSFSEKIQVDICLLGLCISFQKFRGCVILREKYYTQVDMFE
jgi:hypothetical protein